ncbi:hypothetical protein SAMN05444349_1393 [Bacteroides faecichinchillae]|uniref:Uncharacterized protein n=1 Tax=Bacteroides faecichinchillae TaxID=871325 RepID=A0A1M5EWC4_9BACE|nr:hypothetical protein SAMN05444349_1393 [Bacteroides faecichinchillae]
MKLTEKTTNLKKKVVYDAVSEVFLHLIYKRNKKFRPIYHIKT